MTRSFWKSLIHILYYFRHMLFLYRIALFAYGLLIRLLSPWNTKARKFRDGRKDLFRNLSKDFGSEDSLVIWIHAASLGEFEQGRPIIEAIRKSNKPVKILLTFFSPSGYEVRKHYEQVDWVYYLPLDTAHNAKRFIGIVKPQLVIFVKYEFWFFYLKELTERNIPTMIISAIFRKNQLFFHWSGAFFQPILKKIQHYFVQDEESKDLIVKLSSHVTVAGDTRFDRVSEIANQAKGFEMIESFVNGQVCFVIGSSWPSDLKVLTPFIHKYVGKVKFIIAPHNIGEEEISSIQAEFATSSRYSDPKNLESTDVLIIDNIGMLSSLYKYANYTYIGGAFRGALHNTLEAAVFGMPIFFGRHENNKKFKEALELEQVGGAFPIADFSDLEEKFKTLEEDETKYLEVSKASENYVASRTGATAKIMQCVSEII